MRKYIAPAVAAALLSVMAMPAHADMMSYLELVSDPSIGVGPLGLVNVHQNGKDEVDVRVALAKDTGFISTGGPHNAFAFSLNLETAYSVNITTSGFTSEKGPVTNTPYGNFTNGIACTGCGNGGSNPDAGPLEFTITDKSGISLSNFVLNSKNFLFSADVLGPLGGTGNIASGGTPNIKFYLVPTPLPAALPMFGAGLMGVGAFGWRRRKAVAA